MPKDIECPVCGEWNEINHDDGYGYDEDVMYHQDCSGCGKSFGFNTSISFHYYAHRLDCLNTGDHNFKPTFTVPVEYTKMECECGLTRKPTASELECVMIERGYKGEADVQPKP